MGAPTKPSEIKGQQYLVYVDPDDDTKVIEIALVNTGITNPITGNQIYAMGIGSAEGLSLDVIVVSKTIGSITFSGSGLNDMSNDGEFTGVVDTNFVVEIDSVGSPDTFKWSKDGGVTWEATLVPITAADQPLSDGVTIKFGIATTHTGGDEWAFTAKAADPTAIRKNESLILGIASIAPLGFATSNVIDLEQIRSAALTVKGDFHATAVLGMLVEILTSPDNVNWDTQPWASTGLEPTLVAGSTEQKTSNLNTPPRYMKVKVTDLEKGIANMSVRLVAIEE